MDRVMSGFLQVNRLTVGEISLASPVKSSDFVPKPSIPKITDTIKTTKG
jgi:hypothetical protein